MNKETPILYKRKEECCGCIARYAICLQKAIGIVEGIKIEYSGCIKENAEVAI